MAQERREPERRRRDLGVRGSVRVAPDAPIDLVFDSGCLHSLVGGHPSRYMEQLLRWMGPDGGFVLGALGKAIASTRRLDRAPRAMTL